MDDKELQKEFAQYLVKISGAKSEEELKEFVQKLGKDGIQKAYQEFMKEKKKAPQIARKGAKLNFIQKLHGCAEDEETVYLKIGGKFCKKCQKKKQEDGGSIPFKPLQANSGTKLVQDFKSAIQSNKCGSKMKKKEEGGNIEADKCGNKMKKKKEDGGLIFQDKCGSKMKKSELIKKLNSKK